jgi:hypothetical protein
LDSIESSWIRVVYFGASATHELQSPHSVLAFLTSHIGPRTPDLERVDEKLGGEIHPPRAARRPRLLTHQRSLRAQAPAGGDCSRQCACAS